LEAYIESELKPHYSQISKVFEELDANNSGQISKDLLWELFHRFHIKISQGEMSQLWPRFIKAANETLEFHEFMRHFGLKVKSGGLSKRQHLGKRWTEDHCYQRSRTLHREEDMIEQTLKAKLTYYYSSVWKRFIALDPNGTGMVDKIGFHEILQNLVPEMTSSEIDQLGRRYDPYKNGRVNYVSFLEPFKSSDQTYRVGNNMGSLLSHRSKDVTEELKVLVILAEVCQLHCHYRIL
jgi:Ca2+-binding EF-hand superfamily protein